MKRCDYCLDDDCKKKECNCSTCKLVNECYKFLHPTIRITNKCTQMCAHCCFESSPKSNLIMSVDTAMKIGKFLKANDIRTINVMGGEFFCNPFWYEILSILSSHTVHTRLVSNCDWAADKNTRDRLADFINSIEKDSFTISLSYDDYHTNKHFEEAKKFLEGLDCNLTVGKGKEESKGLVPVGRNSYSFGFYSMVGAYCFNPSKRYTFLIDEEGRIYKCPFGRWQYAHIDDYTEGGFAARFKEFNKKFYKIFIPNCNRCNSAAVAESFKEHERNAIVPVLKDKSD